MLTQSEKNRAKLLWESGWSIKEITDDVFDGRYNELYNTIYKEVTKITIGYKNQISKIPTNLENWNNVREK